MAVISSERLHLRELAVDDVGDTYVGWLNDPQVARFLETRWREQTEASVRAFVAAVNARSDEFLYGIFLNENRRHIGNIKVGPIRAHHGVADVSLLIGERDCWGKGFAAEAIAAVSRHAFAHLGVRKLAAGMYAPNEGSRRAFLKLGYKEEGRRRLHYMLDGEPCDLIELGALPEDLA
ncbi:MAG TPA: N-acetyltransferase [Aurantimonas coralicida]|uniref:N-acetyltransferase n=2 Tax=root TaxID=1 RepID=A0A9C9NJ25_9HYPH|nr:N-acetyltransferase [Aurantimonas coralicida]HEU02737.1 N-acetyltransferase [Aurantimonas coralicida]